MFHACTAQLILRPFLQSAKHVNSDDCQQSVLVVTLRKQILVVQLLIVNYLFGVVRVVGLS
jgi:hypothetical protein